MPGETALLTFGIGPVHTFILQARRLADLWAGSYLLSHLMRQAIQVVHGDPECAMVFPFLDGENIPDGLPNRFVCRVPAARAEAIAAAMRGEVERVWNLTVERAVGELRTKGLEPAAELWTPNRTPGALRQTDRLLEIAFSWVPETEGYAAAALAGARRYNAVRRFRPFRQTAETGEKCAICGERTALPDGDRDRVRAAWENAGADEAAPLARFFRPDQGRLCLVCATKRLFAEGVDRRRANFAALDEFQPSEEAPYFALVKVDGDRMSSLLSLGPEAVVGGDLEGFHRAVSRALTDLAFGLQRPHSPELDLDALGGYEPKGSQRPELLYAGGDDVLLACDPRDALPLVSRLRARYGVAFEEARTLLAAPEGNPFTASAAILFAHSGHPAGLLLHDLEILLKDGAKAGAGRDAVAIRLDKRGAAPVEVAFRWSDPAAPAGGWVQALEELADLLRAGGLSSGQSFSLRLEERTLEEVFGRDPERWRAWLADRLGRNEGTAGAANDLAARVVPFFVEQRSEALRIARFLGREVQR
jgi:CRISPR-associated protein Cmr2